MGTRTTSPGLSALGVIPCHSRDALQFTPRRVPRSNGDLTGDGARVFAYDFDNRLSGVTIAGSSTVVTLAYDPASRLAQQQTTVGAGAAVTTRYLYDGARLAAELDGTGAVLRRYVHGPGTDQPVAWYEGAGTADRRWLHADERGSVIAWSNLSAGVVSLSYGPWGEPTAWGGSRFAYTGQIQIAEVQLYHYKGRVYDPVAGRFLQTDPIGYEGGENLYAYVGGDPIDLSDPNGWKQVLAKINMSVSSQGQDFIKGYEKLSLKVYDANRPNGDWTIGYGHKVESENIESITRQQADALFLGDVLRMASHVNSDLKVRVNSNQFDALVSLRFNSGANAVTPPVTDLNRTGQATMSDFTQHYITAGGIPMKGLRIRRAAEWRVYSTGVYDAKH